MYKILCLSSVDYDWMFQRPQQLMRQFARRGIEVLYCNKTQRKDLFFEYRETNLTLCHNREELLKKDIKAEVVWVIDPQLASLKGVFKEKLFVYDYVDDFPMLVLHHHRMLKAADIIITTSQTLLKNIQRYRKDVHLVPNACDYFYFNEMKDQYPLKDFNQKQKTIGYIGAIAPWVDMKLIEAVATRFEQEKIVLIGANLGGIHIPENKNISYLGQHLYEAIPSYLNHMDVVMIPFVKNQVTRATNPIKLYEYLSLGKPIVSVALPEVNHYKQYLYVAKTKEEFIENIKKALRENNPMLVRERMEVAKQNSWYERVNRIDEIIKRYLQ